MKCDNMNVLMSILLIIILIFVIKYFISNKTKEGFAAGVHTCDVWGKNRGNKDPWCKDHRCNLQPTEQKRGSDKWKLCDVGPGWCTKRSQAKWDAPKREAACKNTQNISDGEKMAQQGGWMCREEGKAWLSGKPLCKSHKCDVDPREQDSGHTASPSNREGKIVWKSCGYGEDHWCTANIQKQVSDSNKRHSACTDAKTLAAEGKPDTSSTGLTDAQARSYLSNYSDLQGAFGTDLEKAKSHWLTNGKGEGRTWESADVPDTSSNVPQCRSDQQDHPDGGCPQHKANGGCSNANPDHEAWRARCPVSCGICVPPTPDTSSTGLSPNDCSCNDEDIKKNIKDIMSNAQEKLKIDLASGTFTCVGNDGKTPAICPWDK